MATKVRGIRLTPGQEDRVAVHAARRQIKKPTTMVQIIFEEGLKLVDGMLRSDEGESGIEWRVTIGGVTSKIEDVPRGATIEAVNGVLCVGRCEDCREPVLDGTEYLSDEEGVLICETCAVRYEEEELRAGQAG